MRSTIELIVTEHALDRLDPPRLRVDEEVRVLQVRRIDNRERVWKCQIESGFLVGVLWETRRRQMLIAMTAISRAIFVFCDCIGVVSSEPSDVTMSPRAVVVGLQTHCRSWLRSQGSLSAS
jgi:hypothetical protein